ncbi:MAG: ABC transporter substrate-binding protein [Candidatus Scalindua sp.]
MKNDTDYSGLKSVLKHYLMFCLLLVLFGQVSCTPNHPYPKSERAQPIFYSVYSEPPKHLDPAISYSSDEYAFLELVYEPPFQYHFLKRPYELEPLTATTIPVAEYYDADGRKLAADTNMEQVEKVVYTIEIKKGINYQNHPCFVKTKWPEEILNDVDHITDFPEVATRELKAIDYVNQIKRLADSRLPCPILPIMAKYIDGLGEFAESLAEDLAAERKRRREEQGAAYNREQDERVNPIHLDLNVHPFPGVKLIDDYTYQIVLKRPYPQILYWLAMPFFAAMPQEAIDFFEQGILRDKGITIDRYPLGTGPYRIEKYDPNLEYVFVVNENFHDEYYPSTGEEGDREKGLLGDAGKKLPFLKKIIFKKEKESIPLWNKFLQGYYDTSGISKDSFGQAIQISTHGNVEASEFLKDRNIRLLTSVSPSTMYIAFNMSDPVVGGYTEEQRKLRQAFSIAIDMEEYIQIFANGRGTSSHSPLPPGIFGYEKEKAGMNPVAYYWDEKSQSAKRRKIDEARKLLAEAGYPNGKDRDGRPLEITFVNSWYSPALGPRIIWFEKQFKKLGVVMKNETSDYNRFREKIDQGNYQFTMWGWNADYPDPENFLFLLYGPNSREKYKGENTSNYDNSEFNRLFKKMETMPSGPERLEIIREMKKILHRDSPWVGGLNPVAYGLFHEWYSNAKPNAMYRGALKFKRIDHVLREEKRERWNQPRFWPVVVVMILLGMGTVPAINTIRRRGKATA